MERDGHGGTPRSDWAGPAWSGSLGRRRYAQVDADGGGVSFAELEREMHRRERRARGTMRGYAEKLTIPIPQNNGRTVDITFNYNGLKNLSPSWEYGGMLLYRQPVIEGHQWVIEYKKKIVITDVKLPDDALHANADKSVDTGKVVKVAVETAFAGMVDFFARLAEEAANSR